MVQVMENNKQGYFPYMLPSLSGLILAKLGCKNHIFLSYLGNINDLPLSEIVYVKLSSTVSGIYR